MEGTLTRKGLSLYWKCQLIGWTLAGLYWGYTGSNVCEFNILESMVHFIGDVAVGILITHSYRHFVLKTNWHTLALRALIPRMLIAATLLAVVFMALILLKLYFVKKTFDPTFIMPFGVYVQSMWLTLLVTGIRMMSIWILAYHLYHFAKREIQTAKENAQLQVMAKDAQLNKLAAQLNPHFFFNSLNNIKFLVNENPAQARRAIDLLSELLRNSLYIKDDKLVRLEEELGLVSDYLELEKLRLEERLQVTIRSDETLNNILVPPLSIQGLVENAIKHGIDQKKEGGMVRVEASMHGSFLQVTVQSPGTLSAIDNGGLGLKNLQERLQLQFNGRASFNIADHKDGTVLATLLIPVA